MYVLISIIISVVALLFAAYMFSWVKKQPSENETIKKLAIIIRQGARTFLKREYMVLAVFAGICALLILSFLPKPIWQGDILSNAFISPQRCQ